MIRFGVDSFIWSEHFSERDLWIIAKAKELGFAVIDIAIANPGTFPTSTVKQEIDRVGIEVVTTTTLDVDTNLISPDPITRIRGVESLKQLVDIALLAQGEQKAGDKDIDGQPGVRNRRSSPGGLGRGAWLRSANREVAKC